MRNDELRRQLDLNFASESLSYEMICAKCGKVWNKRKRADILKVYDSHPHKPLKVFWHFKSKSRLLSQEEIDDFLNYMRESKLL